MTLISCFCKKSFQFFDHCSCSVIKAERDACAAGGQRRSLSPPTQNSTAERVQFPKVGRGCPERVQGSGLKCGVTGPVAISVSTPTPERSRVPGAGSTYLGTAPPPNLPHKSGSSFMDGMDEFPDNRQLIAESFGLWASAYTMLYYSFGKFHFQR